MTRDIRFGIVGCGAIAAHHAEAIRRTEGAVFAGATDARPEAAKAFCEQNGGRAYESFEALCSANDVDVICILTPSGLHARQTIAAVQAGKHVLVEKPLALNVADCDRIIEAAKETGVKVGVVCQYRFCAPFMHLKQAVDEGRLGRIVTADISMKYHRDPEYYASSAWRGTWAMDGGGALMNQGIHGIDSLLHIMGPVKSVYGLARTLIHSIEVEDTALAAVEFQCGALGYIQGTTSVSPGYPRRLSISGAKGTITVCEQLITEWAVEGYPMPGDLTLGGEQRSGASKPLDFDVYGHMCHIRDMVEAVRVDRAPAVCCEDARRAIRLITAIYRSSREGKRIDMEE